jgi:hypothetical protein
MGGTSGRVVAALALAVLLVFGVVACGGDDDSTTASPSSGGEKTTGGERSQAQGGADSDDRGEARAKPAPADEKAPADDVDTAPLKVSGGGSEQFRVKGGDNSIQEYGEEDEDGLEAAAEAVHGFYVARAEEDWATACSYLAESMIAQLEQLAARSNQDGELGCAKILASLTPPLSAAVRRESTIVDAGSLRRGEENSFLIYRGDGGTVYAMPLEEEEGAWKLTLLSATPLG